MTEEGLEHLNKRLDRLECEARRWKITSVVASAFIMLTVLGGAAAPRPEDQRQEPTPGWTAPQVVDEIRTKRLLVVDDNGKFRAVLGAATAGAVSLGLLDSQDTIRSVLIVDANGVPHLDLLDADATRRVVLSVFPKRAGLALFGEAARGGAILDVAADGTAGLGLTDRADNPRAAFLLRADGAVLLNLNDPAGKLRASLGVHNTGATGLGMWDKDGKRVWQAPPSERTQ